MAALLDSLSFAFTNSFLPKYRVKYYDYLLINLETGSHQKKLTNPTPEGFRGYLLFVGGMWHDSSRW